jgi:hypothetical protein
VRERKKEWGGNARERMGKEGRGKDGSYGSVLADSKHY